MQYTYLCKNNICYYESPKAYTQYDCVWRNIVFSFGVYASLDTQYQAHQQCMIYKYEISNYDSSCTLELKEVSQCRVYTIKYVSINIHNQIIHAVALHSTFILMIAYDLSLQFSYTCPQKEMDQAAVQMMDAMKGQVYYSSFIKDSIIMLKITNI